MQYQVAVLIEKAGNNYSAYAPEVPGCVATGKTPQLALQAMQRALGGHLALMAQDGDAMPDTAPMEAHVLTVELSETAASEAGATAVGRNRRYG